MRNWAYFSPQPVQVNAVKSGADGLKEFSEGMKNPDTAPLRLTFSPAAHILRDAKTGMWGAVFFTAGPRGAGHERNGDCPLLAVDRPCSVALKPGKSTLTVAVSGGEELLTAPAPFALTLKGRWALAEGVGAAASVAPDPTGGDTGLTVAPAAPAGAPVRLIAR